MGRALFPPSSLTWDQTMVQVMRIMVTSFKRSHAPSATLNASNSAQANTDLCLCQRLLTLTGKFGPVSCGVTAPFSWVLVLTRFCLCPPRVCKLEMVKKEMARVNINILGISKLKWTEMGEFNSHDHYIYYSRQESLRRNGVANIINKSSKCSTWVQPQIWQNDLCSFPRQTIQYHNNPSLCRNQ